MVFHTNAILAGSDIINLIDQADCLIKGRSIMANEKQYTLEFQAAQHLTQDYYEITLKAPANFTWEPGQYTHFSLPDHEIEGKKQRALSFASLPDEKHILLGTRMRQTPSSFKATFLGLALGAPVVSNGPQGEFLLPEADVPLVFFAGGVGITPIRALIRALTLSNRQQPYTLIYSSDDFYFFDADFSTWAQQQAQFTYVKTQTVDQTHEQLQSLVQTASAQTQYYLSSSPKIVQSMKEFLGTLAVDPEQIHLDQLYGY